MEKSKLNYIPSEVKGCRYVDESLQKIYTERLNHFFALAEMSYKLRTSPRIIKKK